MPTTFYEMYHPALDNRIVDVPEQAVDEYEARGWLLVDPEVSPPEPVTPYYTKAAADSRYVRDSELDSQAAALVEAGSGALPDALRAASVAAVQEAIDEHDLDNILTLDLPPFTLKDSSDTRAGVFDWEHDSPAGFLLHLRAGPNSAARTGIIGLGTDQGSADGLLINHKNQGAGLRLVNFPGALIGAYLQGYSSTPLLWAEVFGGSGGLRIDSEKGQSFTDGATTGASTTFTSATANFTGGDVGAAIRQIGSRGLDDALGTIPEGVTITAVTNSTTVTLSAPATRTGSGIRFLVGNRVPAATQRLIAFFDHDNVLLADLKRGSFDFSLPVAVVTNDVAVPAIKATGKAAQTADILAVYVNGNATSAMGARSNGQAFAAFTSYVSNAGITGADPLTVQNFAVARHNLVLKGIASQTGDLLRATDASNNPMARISKAGAFITKSNAAPADADLAAGEMAIWFDQTNGAAKLMVKSKEAGGTVRTGQLALA